MRWNWRATSLSMPGRMRSRYSITSTSEPSRRQTDPSSSPITPAPMTKKHLWDGGQFERAGGRDNRHFVDRDTGQRRHIGPGRDDDVFRFETLVRAVLAQNLDLTHGRDPRRAVEHVDLVFFEQELDALDVALNALVLEGHHLLQIERRLDLNAEVGEMVRGVLEHMGGVQQSF